MAFGLWFGICMGGFRRSRAGGGMVCLLMLDGTCLPFLSINHAPYSIFWYEDLIVFSDPRNLLPGIF